MKKIITMALVVFLCAGFAAAQTGRITEISGTVELKPAGTAGFIPAKTGDTLSQDTIVSTGFKSSALITIGSSVITVRPLTRLSLAELSAAGNVETINVSLQSGRVRVDVNPPAGTRTNMTVRGPSATASVRGTGFDFDTRNLYVRHGVVAFQGAKGGVRLVGEGAGSALGASGKAADPIETTAIALVPPAPKGSDSGISRGGGQKDLAELSINLNYDVQD